MNEKKTVNAKAPDYSKYTHTFDSYAYSGPSDGKYRIDGEVFDLGQDFRTKERLQEYKDAGFSIWMPQTTISIQDAFDKEAWENEKKYLDIAHEVGLKVILCDRRLQELSTQEGGLIYGKSNKEGRFSTQEELDAYVKQCIALYKDHPAFYGLMLGDEPRIFHVTAYGETYGALKRVLPNKFIQYNLLPLRTDYRDIGSDRFPVIDEKELRVDTPKLAIAFARYEKYLNAYADAMPSVEYLQFDDYPIHPKFTSADYIPGLQIAAKVCAERNIQLHVVSQTFAMHGKGQDSELWWSTPNEKELYWMNNILLGFGVKQIHYFTYWTKADNSTTGEFFVDGGSFVSRTGEKTLLYDNVQKMMAENQAFAPVIKQFEYQGARAYLPAVDGVDASKISRVINMPSFAKLANVHFEKEAGLVTQLYDSENDRYMYMVMDIGGGKNTVAFVDGYTHAIVYQNGVGTVQKLDENHALSIELEADGAVFVLPY